MEDESISLFLADDHTLVRQGIAALVSKLPNVRVIGECGDGRAVVEEVTRLKPDVVVLDLSSKTIDTHRAHLMRKLGIHDQTSLVKFAIRRGIVQVR